MNDLSIFFKPGDTVEIRALGKLKGVVQSGYFRDHAKLEETIRVLDATGEHKGIYFVLNEINPALYARRPDGLSQPREQIATTSDVDILRRRWFPVDFDPVRPAEISSSDAEHEAALQRAREVCTHLRDLGWPEPILADSGNGAHLLYRIDLPNDKDATDLVEAALKALDALFSDEKVKIDTKNYNAARIWKAYGTWTRKGANVPDAPWRKSQVLRCPADIQHVDVSLLDDLAWGYRQKEQHERYSKPSDGKIDLGQWLASKGLDVVKTKAAHGGGQMFILDTCPWDSAHTDRSAWVVQFPSGAIAAGCHHDGCSGKSWRDLRRIYEPHIEPRMAVEENAPTRPMATELTLSDVADIEYADNGDIKSIRFNPNRAADAICQYMHILSTPDEKIWVYKDGYYSPDGSMLIRQVFDRVAGGCFTIALRKETLEKIFLRTVVDFNELDKNPYLLCCKNGVVDLLTGTFSEHRPEYNCTMPIPVKYDPNARPKAFLEFLEGACTNDDDRLTMLDWMVACACLVEFEYLLFLTGHGSNGKRVYEALLREFFGEAATEAIGLGELTSSRFALGYLRRARMCISTETNPDKTETELLKKVSGNDWLSVDVKNRDRIKFLAFTQMMFDTNSMPAFEDTSYGFARRFTRVNMPFKFCDNPDPAEPLQKKADRQLLAKLTSEEEMSGILNLIILRAKDIAAKRIIHRRENDFEAYERQSYSLQDFVDRFIEIDPDRRFVEDYQTGSDHLYAKFLEYAKYSVGAKLPRKAFSRLMGRECGESSRTIWKDGMAVRGFRGVKFHESEFNTFISECKTSLLVPNDLIVSSKKIVRYNNDISRDDPNDLTILTIYREYIQKLEINSCIYGCEFGTKSTGSLGFEKSASAGHGKSAETKRPNDPKSLGLKCDECERVVDSTTQLAGPGDFSLNLCEKCYAGYFD